MTHFHVKDVFFKFSLNILFVCKILFFLLLKWKFNKTLNFVNRKQQQCCTVQTLCQWEWMQLYQCWSDISPNTFKVQSSIKHLRIQQALLCFIEVSANSLVSWLTKLYSWLSWHLAKQKYRMETPTDLKICICYLRVNHLQ